MFEIDLEVAADILDYPVIAPDDIEEGYFGVIHNNKVVASPYYMSEVMPVSTEFFLLTTHARVAAYFHQVRKRPVWICNNVEDFYFLQIPPFAGRDEAWILTSLKEYPKARPCIEQNILKARHIYSLGGYEQDLMRAFLPEKYEELYCSMPLKTLDYNDPELPSRGEIRAAMLARLPEVLRHLFPNGKQLKNEF